MPATDILGKIGEKVGGQIKTLETTITNDFATKVELGAVQSELDTTQASAGLGVSGAYVPETNSSYINGATSLAGADSLIDAAVGVHASAISSHSNLISGLDSNKYDKTGGTISGAVTITGDLTVSGTTTTVNSTEVSVADNNIEVNLATDGGKTSDTGGFNVNRGADQVKAGLVWSDTSSKWSALLGANLADFEAGTITASLTGNVVGNLTGNVTGVVTVPNANGLVINATSLGDYSTFETAFNTAIA